MILYSTKPVFNRFRETVATARRDNFWINYCSFSWKNLIDRLFFQPIKILHLTRHAPRVTPRFSRAFFLFRCVYKIHYRKSWIINNLLNTLACSTAVHFYSSFVSRPAGSPKYCTTLKKIQPYYTYICLPVCCLFLYSLCFFCNQQLAIKFPIMSQNIFA